LIERGKANGWAMPLAWHTVKRQIARDLGGVSVQITRDIARRNKNRPSMHSQPEERRKKIEDLRKNLLKPVASKKTGPAHVASVNVGSTDTARPIAAAVKRMAPRPVAATSGTSPLLLVNPVFVPKPAR
jgi:hypothetical protein